MRDNSAAENLKVLGDVETLSKGLRIAEWTPDTPVEPPAPGLSASQPASTLDNPTLARRQFVQTIVITNTSVVVTHSTVYATRPPPATSTPSPPRSIPSPSTSTSTSTTHTGPFATVPPPSTRTSSAPVISLPSTPASSSPTTGTPQLTPNTPLQPTGPPQSSSISILPTVTVVIVTTPNSTPTTSAASSGSHVQVAAVVGGVLGGLALVLAVLIILYIWRWRGKRGSESEDGLGRRQSRYSSSQSALQYHYSLASQRNPNTGSHYRLSHTLGPSSRSSYSEDPFPATPPPLPIKPGAQGPESRVPTRHIISLDTPRQPGPRPLNQERYQDAGPARPDPSARREAPPYSPAPLVPPKATRNKSTKLRNNQISEAYGWQSPDSGSGREELMSSPGHRGATLAYPERTVPRSAFSSAHPSRNLPSSYSNVGWNRAGRSADDGDGDGRMREREGGNSGVLR